MKPERGVVAPVWRICRKRPGLLGGVAAALLLSALPVLPTAAPASAAAGTGAADEQTASAQAQTSGEPVEVTADRTESENRAPAR